MGRDYSMRTIKTLFGCATHCAYPDCSNLLVFEDSARGIRSIAVQIAHIRSEKLNGPRYEAGYPKEKLNQPENLLLLCGTHHPAVDQNESVFTTPELLGWKELQSAQGGGTAVSEAELAALMQSLQSALSGLRAALQVDVEVAVVGGRATFDGAIVMPLEGLDSITIESSEISEERLVGVEVTNKGFAGVEVAVAGLIFDFELAETATWQLNDARSRHPLPHRLLGHDSGHWFIGEESLRATLRKLAPQLRRVPSRFKAYALLGDKRVVESEWVTAILLPIWKSGTTDDDLRQINEAGENRRAGR